MTIRNITPPTRFVGLHGHAGYLVSMWIPIVITIGERHEKLCKKYMHNM